LDSAILLIEKASSFKNFQEAFQAKEPFLLINSAMTPTTWKEKRQFVRANFGWPAALINGQGVTLQGRVRDISSDGALVHIKTKLNINDSIELAVNVPDFKHIISAKGTVVRVNILDEETSSPTYALGIHLPKMSSKGIKYFSGNLPPGWRKRGIEEKQEKTSMPLQWVARGGIALASLVVIGTVLFQSFFQVPSIIQKDLLLLPEGINKDLQLLGEVSRQQATTITQIGKRLEETENSSISLDQIEQILSLLNSQIQDMQQIKITLQNQPETRKKGSVDKALSGKEAKASSRDVSTHHAVRPEEDAFLTSQQHNSAVDELLHYDPHPTGTITFSTRKLQISSNFSTFQTE
jgi:PilZ domain-containing protein